MRALQNKRKIPRVHRKYNHCARVNQKRITSYEYKDKEYAESLIGKPMSEGNASVGVSDLFIRAGLPGYSANSIRKFNTTALTMSGMGEDRIRLMQGKSQRSSIDSYLDAEVDTMREAYKQYYSYLSLSGQTEKEMAALIAKQEHANGELSDLRQQMVELQDGYRSQQSQLSGALAMISTLTPEQQAEMVKKLKEAAPK